MGNWEINRFAVSHLLQLLCLFKNRKMALFQLINVIALFLFFSLGYYFGNYSKTVSTFQGNNRQILRSDEIFISNTTTTPKHVSEVTPSHDHFAKCKKVFRNYLPSAFEQHWVDVINSTRKDICNHIMLPEQISKFRIWLNITDEVSNENKTCGTMRQSAEVDTTQTFSFMEYEYICEDNAHPIHGKFVKEAIEPLAGYVRESRPLCKRMFKQGSMKAVTDLADRNFILFKSYRCDTIESSIHPPSGPRLIIIDAGSTTYLHSNSGPSQSYLIEKYRSLGYTNLERFIAWEVKKYDPEYIFEIVPDNVLPHYQFFNRKCDGIVNSKHNPLTFIKKLATPQDMVVLKLDVDQKDVELPIVRQILDDPELQGLIDEFFFEHHSDIEELKWAWGTAVSGTIVDTYQYFSGMRQKGIRAHSWI